MTENSDRKELERRLEQAKRAAALGNDPVTTERLQKLVKELEEQLRLSEEDHLASGRHDPAMWPLPDPVSRRNREKCSGFTSAAAARS
jgi:hypothetical protein